MGLIRTLRRRMGQLIHSRAASRHTVLPSPMAQPTPQTLAYPPRRTNSQNCWATQIPTAPTTRPTANPTLPIPPRPLTRLMGQLIHPQAASRHTVLPSPMAQPTLRRLTHPSRRINSRKRWATRIPTAPTTRPTANPTLPIPPRPLTRRMDQLTCRRATSTRTSTVLLSLTVPLTRPLLKTT